jgi:DNA-binding XRE family transcriptional regulator
MSYFDRKWRLCACRINAGYKQEEVAEILGVTPKTVVAWEQGHNAMKMSTAQKLSELYQIPLAYMDFSKEGNRVPLRYREREEAIPMF